MLKKWLALLLTALLLVSEDVLAESSSEVKEITFEMFYAEYGVPYEGKWICLDDAIFFYVPLTLPQAEITDEMRNDEVLAYYSDTDEQGNTLWIQISRQTENAFIKTIVEECQNICTDVEIAEINGMSAMMGLCISKSERHMEAYVEAIAANGVSYRFAWHFTAAEEISDMTLAINALGMLSSFSEMPLEISAEEGAKENNGMEGMPERMIRCTPLQFTFHDRAVEDLEQINRLLAVMDLTNVRMESFEGYLATTQTMEEGVVIGSSYRYGFDNCTLMCEKTEFGQTHRYQIMTEVFEGVNAMGNEQYEAYWHAIYPHCRLTSLTEVVFDEQTAYVVVYFEADTTQMKP